MTAAGGVPLPRHDPRRERVRPRAGPSREGAAGQGRDAGPVARVVPGEISDHVRRGVGGQKEPRCHGRATKDRHVAKSDRAESLSSRSTWMRRPALTVTSAVSKATSWLGHAARLLLVSRRSDVVLARGGCLQSRARLSHRRRLGGAGQRVEPVRAIKMAPIGRYPLATHTRLHLVVVDSAPARLGM